MEGYTFDRIKVQAANDGALYNLLNNGQSYAVNNLKNGVNISVSGLNAYIDTGFIIVQGRFIEIEEKYHLSLPANSEGYIVIEIDLTQVNDFTGTPGNADYVGVNNQLELKYISDMIPGNINDNDKLTTFGLAKYTTTGTVATIEKIENNYKSYKYLIDDINSKEPKVNDTGWLNMVLINGWRGEIALRQINGRVYFRGYLESAAGNGQMASVAFKTPAQIVMYGTSWIPFDAPSGEMNASLVELKMTGLIKLDTKECYVWYKNTTGKCYLDNYDIDRMS